MSVQTMPPSAAGGAAATRDLGRKDSWWVGPLTFFLIFSAFGAWATLRAFQNGFYEFDNYLSPFYAPTIQTGWHLGPFAISPALLILPFPLSFRLSCYYYRRSIYRAYLADPLACAVREPAPLEKARFRRYMGERGFPLIVQNFHRYAFFAAVVFIVLLWIDAIKAFFHYANPAAMSGGTHFGLHIGNLVFLANIVLLSVYTFSCHSFRHFLGGSTDCYSCTLANRTKYGLWKKISFLNEQHGRWAMWSLCSVALTDVYVYLLASGRLHDITLF